MIAIPSSLVKMRRKKMELKTEALTGADMRRHVQWSELIIICGFQITSFVDNRISAQELTSSNYIPKLYLLTK